MEKFNYTVTVEAPSKEIANMLMDFICKDNIGILQLLKQAGEKKTPEPKVQQEKEKEKLLSGLAQFEKVIQIIERCINDETTIDQIVRFLGINVQPQKTTQE